MTSDRTDVRIGDAERDAATAALGEHFAAGRLSREELDERLERAWAARTAEDLDPLFVDLPRPSDQLALSRSNRGEPVGFHQTGRGPLRRYRTPIGLPPPIVPILVVALVITLLTHVPVIFFVLGALWFTGLIGHRGRWHSRSWAHSG